MTQLSNIPSQAQERKMRPRWKKLSPNERRTVHAAAILCVSIILYGRCVTFESLEIDDPKHIFENPLMANPWQAFEFWTRPYFNLFIPMTYTLWAAFSATSLLLFGKLRPEVFHLANLALHTLNAFLLWRLLGQLTKQRNASLFATLIFLCHPLQIPVVAWISALKDSLSVFWGLVGLHLYLKHKNKGFWLAYLLAALSKPGMVVLGPIAALLRKPTNGWWHWLGSALILLPIFLMTHRLQPAPHPLNLIERLALATKTTAFYVSKLFFPTPIVLDYALTPQMLLERPWTILEVGSLCLLLILLVKQFRGTVWFLIVLIPTSGIVAFSFQKFSSVAPHYAYFSLPGICLLLAQWASTQQRQCVLAGITLMLAISTTQQLAVWRDTVSLLSHNAKEVPSSFLSHNNLGVALYHKGAFAQAAEHFEKASQLNPSEIELKVNIAASFNALGERKKSIQILRKILEEKPDSTFARSSLEKLLRKEGQAP